jgi:predicted NBD/HSP70 family sugar kinase
MRRHNVATVLRQVHVHGAVSRAELTSVTGLSRSTIMALVASLVQARLVAEDVPDRRTGAGRPSHVVRPRPESAYVLGASVDVAWVRVAAVGLGGAVLARHDYRLGEERARPASVAGRLARALGRLAAEVPDGARAVGVGVGVPGVVRRADGHVELAPNLGWRDAPFGALLAERLDPAVPLRVANDGDVGAVAEHVRGAGREVRSMVYLAGGVGVGGGVVVDGAMLHGTAGYAGEVGHMVVNPDGRPCRCGSVGCLETEIGEEALLRAAGRRPDGGGEALAEVLAAAAAGETRARDGVARVAHWLARGVATLVNVLNPELVVLGGPLGGIFLAAEDLVRRDVARFALDPSWPRTRLELPVLGGDSVLLGAAELAFDGLLGDPLGAVRTGFPAPGAALSSAATSAGPWPG